MKTPNVDKVVRYALYILFLTIPLTVAFVWEIDFNLDLPVDSGRLGTFGDFFGGVFGSIWSLCGVIIFYIALKEQREDFKTNKDSFEKQTEALTLQIEEFKLQREELTQTRLVFIDQSKTFKQQRISNTYFSLLDLYRKIVQDLNHHANGNYFKDFKTELYSLTPYKNSFIETHEHITNKYLDLYYPRGEELSHYFKIVYRILKIVDGSELDEDEKLQFVTILRSQLTENEMLALYYNAHSAYGKNSYQYILRYNLLKHLPCLSKPEFRRFLVPSSKPQSIEKLNEIIFATLIRFLSDLRNEVKKEDFLEHRVSFEIQPNLVLIVSSTEIDELTLTIAGTSEVPDVFSIAWPSIGRYLEFYLLDILHASRYELDKIRTQPNIKLEYRKVTIELKSSSIFALNTDQDGIV